MVRPNQSRAVPVRRRPRLNLHGPMPMRRGTQTLNRRCLPRRQRRSLHRLTDIKSCRTKPLLPAHGGVFSRGSYGSPNQDVPELPRICCIDVLRKESGAIGQRCPVGVIALYRTEIGALDFEAAAEVHLVGLDDAGFRIF